MCQRVASTVPFDTSSLVSCAPFIIHGNFAVSDTAGCGLPDRVLLAEVRWIWRLLAEVKVGENIPGLTLFLILAFPCLKERFLPWERTSQAGKTDPWEPNFSNELVTPNLVKITTRLEIQGARCKIEKGPQISTGAHGFLPFSLP